MKRIFFAILAVFLFVTTADSAVVYYRQALTGGAGTALDGQDGADLDDLDLAIVADGTDIYHYQLDATSGAAESSPDIISPDTNAGTKRWLLQNVYSVTSGVNPPAGVELVGGIAGLNLSNDTDTDHDVNVTAGACMDSTGVYHVSLASEITKQIDAAWAAGDDAGGLLNGSVATSKLYHVYLLRKDADGTGDMGFLADGDAIATYKPAGYTYYRWVGFVVTDSSANIEQFIASGNYITWLGGLEGGSTASTSYVLLDLSGILPDNRVEVGRFGHASSSLSLSVNGTSQLGSTSPATWYSPQWMITPPNGEVYGKVASGTGVLYVYTARITR